MELISYVFGLGVNLILGSVCLAHTGCVDGPGKMKCQYCKPGYYGSDCSQTCQGNCDTDGCVRQTGICYRCRPGYYGDLCQQRCPADCYSNLNFRIPQCHRKDGFCIQECGNTGKTGSFCNWDCPFDCLRSVCTKWEGICFLGCDKGWAGENCTLPCNNCGGRCSASGYCLTHCKSGYYGDRCDKVCPNCYTTGCDRQTGICEQCHPGFHGTRCNHRCSDTCYQSRDGHRHCNRHHGDCSVGCMLGWHGSHCRTPCNSNCRENKCHSHDGYCTLSCRIGRYGSHCNSTCADHCKSGCHRHTGDCLGGCKPGYYGQTCDKVCKHCAECDQSSGKCLKCHEGHYGLNCTSQCNVNCAGTTCHYNGTCKNGCSDRFYGDLCQNECPPNCRQCSMTPANVLECVKDNSENGISKGITFNSSGFPLANKPILVYLILSSLWRAFIGM